MHDTESLRDIVEHASDLIYTHDLEGCITSVNAAAERHFGIPREKAIGMQISEVIAPEDRARAKEMTMQKLQQGGGSTTYTLDVVSANGERFPVEVSTQIIYRDGKPVGVQGIARDVSERVKAEQALERSERYFRTLIEEATDAITVINADGTIRYQSPSVKRILGYTTEDRRGKPVFDIAHPEDLQIAQKYFKQLLAEPSRPVTAIIRARAKSGEWRHVEFRVRNLIDDPVVGGLVLNWRDVTEHVRTTQQLEEREQFFRSIIERSTDILCVIDAQAIVRYVSPALTEVLGYDASDLVDTLGMQFVHPDDAAKAQEMNDAIFVHDQPFASAELRALHKDGSLRIFDVRLRNLLNDPILNGVIVDARDITDTRMAAHALQESETRFRKFLETAAEGCVIRDSSGRITFANERFASMFGYTVDEVLGRNIFDLIDPDDAERMAASAERRKVTGSSEQSDINMVCKDGRRVPVLLSASPLFGRNGDYIGALGMITDLSERKHLEEQLRQSQKIEAVGRLAGGIAHDFNNLLTAVSGHVELLLTEIPPDAPWRHDIEQIRLASDRAAGLTQQLLAFSRRQMLQPRVIHVDRVVKDVANLLRTLIGEDIRLVTELSTDGARVRADRGQMEQVLMNLVVNARDAMPNGGTLTLKTSIIDVDDEFVRMNPGAVPGNHIELCVRDTGMGMDVDTMSHLFEPFFTTKGLGKGTGLGLATVYGVVKQSGGYIRVESEMGKGTEFQILLPVVDEAADPEVEAERVASPRGNGETILIAEDEGAVRSLASRILKKHGFNVLEACNGREALDVAAGHEGRIDMLLTDIVMPNLGGRELSEKLIAQRPDLKVLFMSGYTDDALIQRGVLEGTGIGRFLEKPFTPLALATKIKEVLES